MLPSLQDNPLVIPTPWYSYPCVVPSHIHYWSLWPKKYGRRVGMSFLRLCCKKLSRPSLVHFSPLSIFCPFLPIFSSSLWPSLPIRSLTLGEASCQAIGEVHLARNWSQQPHEWKWILQPQSKPSNCRHRQKFADSGDLPN